MNSARRQSEKVLTGGMAKLERVRELEAALTRPLMPAPHEVPDLPPSIKSLLNRSVDLIYLVNEDASFIAVNEAVCQLVGYTADELLALKVHDIDVIYDSVNWQKTFKRLRKLGSFRLETLQRNREGETFPVEWTLNYLIHNGRELCLGVGRDITERKKVEEARGEIPDRSGRPGGNDMPIRAGRDNNFCQPLLLPVLRKNQRRGCGK
jgi:PAS domain S-box-containing protein